MSTTKAWIYGLKDPQTGEIRYVGKALTPEIRRLSHIRNAKKWDKSHKGNWIKSLLKKGMAPSLVLLRETDDSKWQQDEMELIAFGRANGWPLTNMTSGGDGFHGMSDDIKAKISAAHKGKRLSLKTRKAISKRRKGVPTTLGFHHSAESRAKMSASHAGKPSGRKGKKLTLAQRDAIKRGWITRKQRHIQKRDEKGKFVSKEKSNV